MPLTYSVITPVRDEADTLPTLAGALASQTQLPERWIIVEGGSRDGTRAVASAIVDEHPWARLLVLAGCRCGREGRPDRPIDPRGNRVAGRPVRRRRDRRRRCVLRRDVLRAAPRGIRATARPRYRQWERMGAVGRAVAAAIRDRGNGLGRDAALTDGSASTPFCPSRSDTAGTESTSSRPERAGGRRETIVSLPFRHHRPEGIRDGSRWAALACERRYRALHGLPAVVPDQSGRLFQMRRDRAAFALIVGYAAAALRPRAAPRRSRSPRGSSPRPASSATIARSPAGSAGKGRLTKRRSNQCRPGASTSERACASGRSWAAGASRHGQVSQCSAS